MAGRVPIGDRWSPEDRLFNVMLAVSLAAHVGLLGSQIIMAGVSGWSEPQRLRVVYETEPDKSSYAANSPLTNPQAVLPSPTGPSGAEAAGAAAGASFSGDALESISAQVHSRVVNASSQNWPTASMGLVGTNWATAIDLTDIPEVVQSNPVLMAYFSALRDQIQQTANARAWQPDGAAEGIVCVGFVITRYGEIQSLRVIDGRSVASQPLRNVAVDIVKAAGPFPPFPPSFTESSKTVVIPLEFVLSK